VLAGVGRSFFPSAPLLASLAWAGDGVRPGGGSGGGPALPARPAAQVAGAGCGLGGWRAGEHLAAARCQAKGAWGSGAGAWHHIGHELVTALHAVVEKPALPHRERRRGAGAAACHLACVVGVPVYPTIH
jgi:hypothetical protein